MSTAATPRITIRSLQSWIASSGPLAYRVALDRRTAAWQRRGDLCAALGGLPGDGFAGRSRGSVGASRVGVGPERILEPDEMIEIGSTDSLVAITQLAAWA